MPKIYKAHFIRVKKKGTGAMSGGKPGRSGISGCYHRINAETLMKRNANEIMVIAAALSR
jgi:hypothetical protein